MIAIFVDNGAGIVPFGLFTDTFEVFFRMSKLSHLDNTHRKILLRKKNAHFDEQIL